MQTLDLVIIVVLGIGLLRGFRTGFVRQAASLAGLVLAFLVGTRLMEPVGAVVAQSIGASETTGPVLGFIVVFLILWVGVFMVSRLAESVIKKLKLTTVDRTVGGVAGGFKAALILSIVFLVMGRFSMPQEASRTESVLYASVAGVLPAAWDFVAGRWPEVEGLSERFGTEVETRMQTQIEAGR